MHRDVEGREALCPAPFSWSPTSRPLANLERGSADYTSQAIALPREVPCYTLFKANPEASQGRTQRSHLHPQHNYHLYVPLGPICCCLAINMKCDLGNSVATQAQNHLIIVFLLCERTILYPMYVNMHELCMYGSACIFIYTYVTYACMFMYSYTNIFQLYMSLDQLQNS